MQSTGNDIVALAAINIARTKEARFYSKIILPAEEALYQNLPENRLPFENFVWLAWTIKESVYKFCQRLRPGLVFSPSKIILSKLEQPDQELLIPACFEDRDLNFPTYRGVAEFGAETFYSRSVITRDYIFSLVNSVNDFSETCWGIKQINSNVADHQSAEVRSFILSKLRELFPDTDLIIDKNRDGLPVILNEGAEFLPVSLTHHDHFVAYSFQIS